jgi:hypothetical protein
VTRPLPARLVLLAAAAALAAAMVFSLLVAEARDFDRPATSGPGAVSELRVDGQRATPLVPVSRTSR